MHVFMCMYIYIYIYIYIYMHKFICVCVCGICSIMVIIVGNRYRDPSSNTEQD